MLCGGGNCKIVKRHFPAICMAIQPESSCERRVCSQPSHSPGQKTLPCGLDECVFVFVGCLYVLCLLRMHWPGVNWIMFAAQLKLQALWQQSNPCKSITARKSNVKRPPCSLSHSLSSSNQCSCIQSGHDGLQLKEGSWLWMWSMTSHKGLNRQPTATIKLIRNVKRPLRCDVGDWIPWTHSLFTAGMLHYVYLQGQGISICALLRPSILTAHKYWLSKSNTQGNLARVFLLYPAHVEG